MTNPRKLFVALPSYGSVPMGFVKCLIKLLMDPPVALQVCTVDGDSLVSRARNTLTASFLASDCTDFLFIDTDLIFSGEQIARMLAHDVPIVGGFYPKKQDGALAWVCNAKLDFPAPDARGLQSLRYIGTGFLLVKREVFTRMIEAHPESAYIADGTGRAEHDLWPVGIHDGRYLSEDWAFCQRALDLGYDVLGDTQVILKHIGTAVFPLQSQLTGLSGSALGAGAGGSGEPSVPAELPQSTPPSQSNP
jgi:hypothetical protein